MHQSHMDKNQPQTPTATEPKIMFGYGYLSDNGESFIPLTPFYVESLPFFRTGPFTWSSTRGLPNPPLLIDLSLDGIILEQDQDNSRSLPEPHCTLLQVLPANYGSSQNHDENKNSSSIPRLYPQMGSKTQEPPVFHSKLNPKANEFFAVQALSELTWNPHAPEFIPRCVNVFSPALSTTSCSEGMALFDEHAETSFDTNGFGWDEDIEPQEGVTRVVLEDSSLLQGHLVENGSWNKGLYSQAGQIPIDSPFKQEADFYNSTGSAEEEGEGKHCIDLGLEPFMKLLPTTPIKNGDFIPFYVVDDSETISNRVCLRDETELVNSIVSQTSRSLLTQEGIPVLLTQEVQKFTNGLAKLPEPLRVVHATADTPYTRVYGLGGFELKSDQNSLTLDPFPSTSIEAYLLSEETEEDKKEKYVPSYGFIGFGIDESLSIPFSPAETHQEEVAVPEILSDYELVYGLVGYLPTPAHLVAG